VDGHLAWIEMCPPHQQAGSAYRQRWSRESCPPGWHDSMILVGSARPRCLLW